MNARRQQRHRNSLRGVESLESRRLMAQLEIRLDHAPDARPLMLGLRIGDFDESDTLPPPPLPEAELARVARALGRPLPWELGGNGVVTRQGQIDAKAAP